MNPLIRLCGLKRHHGLCDLTGRAEGTVSDRCALTVEGVLTCRQNTGTAAPITLGLLTSANLRQARIKSATGSLLRMSESRQVNRGRSATDVKGAWLR